MGFDVVRFSNEEVRVDMDVVCARILWIAAMPGRTLIRLLPQPASPGLGRRLACSRLARRPGSARGLIAAAGEKARDGDVLVEVFPVEPVAA